MSLKLLFKKYPALIPFGAKCFCGIPSRGFKPLIIGDLVGIEAANCACGRSGVCVVTPINQDNSGLRELAKEICDTMADYDNRLREAFLNMSLSRRERRRIIKAERQARIKERKNVKRKNAKG